VPGTRGRKREEGQEAKEEGGREGRRRSRSRRPTAATADDDNDDGTRIALATTASFLFPRPEQPGLEGATAGSAL